MLVDCAVNGTTAAAINIGDVPVVQDLALDYIGRTLLTDYEKLALDNDDSATGTLLDPQGALLFQPFSQDLIIFDVHTLQMVERIAMPTNIAQIGAGALALDAGGLRIFALTASGLTRVILRLALAELQVRILGVNY